MNQIPGLTPFCSGSSHPNRYHWEFDDPAKVEGTEEEIRVAFRRICDEIKLVFEAYACGYRETHSVGR